MSADFNPLDTTGRGKVTAGIQELLNAGLSMDQIMSMYKNVSAQGDALLKQRYNAIQYQDGQAAPGYEAARDRMRGDPIYGSTGYGAQLDRNEWGNVMGRLNAGYLGAAADQTQSDIGFLGGLYNQRAAGGMNLTQQGYGSMFGLPKAVSTGDKLGAFAGQLGGAAIGALAGPAGPAAAAAAGSALGRMNTQPRTTPMTRYGEAQSETVLRRGSRF